MNLRWLCSLGALFLTVLTARSEPAPSASSRELPPALQPWKDWATWDDTHRLCPTPYSDAKQHLCFWPSRFGLQVKKEGAQFDLAVTVFHETWLPLPGNGEIWPVEVRVDGKPVAVLTHDNSPAIKLTAGTFHIEGAFRWTDYPQRLPMPREIGLLSLVVEGQPIASPVWDSEGDLWLRRDGSTEQTDKDSLTVHLYAALEDGNPLWLRTQVELLVSGKSREESLGTIVPEGWKLASVTSPIPTAIDDAGRLKAQVRAGKWTIQADAFRFDNPKTFRFAADAKVPVAEELVAFRAQPGFRVVEITGSTSIDVSQTTFPNEWRSLPVYRWDVSTSFQFEERMRGMGQQKPEGLKIAREWWLDENGGALTFRDHLTGTMQQIWRLDAAPGQDLGSVRSLGQGQLITRNPQSTASGVEIRTRNLNLEATGRMARTTAYSATGWHSDADNLHITLNLPPGSRLFALFGADWVKGDWLTAWTLLDLFLLLVFTLAVFRLWGLRVALLAFAAFGLSYHELGAPRYAWLALIVPLALQRVVPEGWGRRIVDAAKWLTITAFVLVLVPFVAQQVQQALYPQLEEVRSVASSAEAFAPMVLRQDNRDDPTGTAEIYAKLQTIWIPKLELRDATLNEALDYLHRQSIEFDTRPGPRRGVTFVTRDIDSAFRDARTSVSLTNISLIEALKYVTSLSNTKYRVEPDSVVIVPMGAATTELTQEEFAAPPHLVTGPIVDGRINAVELLKSWGATFPEGSSAHYIPSTNRLVVRNTQDNLELVGQMVQPFGVGPAPLAIPGLEPIPGGPSERYSSAPLTIAARRVTNDNLSYDSKSRIQTGPGVPEWTWRQVSFGWNGPVVASQQVTPVLISLGLERLLTVLRVGLLLMLAAVLLGVRKVGGSALKVSGKAVAMAAVLSLISKASAQGIPDSATLTKLRERVLQASDAYPNAAEIPLATLTLGADRKLTLDCEIHAALQVAVPLPGRLPGWSPVAVTLDDRPEVAVRRSDGYLWVVVPAGVHRVRVEGLLANVTEWEWTFQLAPRQVKIEAPDWSVSGLSPSGRPEAQVLFALKQKTSATQATYDRQDLQSVAKVSRTVELGLVWQVHSAVSRLSAPGKAISLRIPLLPGESVLSSGVTVRDGFIEVRLGAQDTTFSWESGLATTPTIQLATRPSDTWVEEWRLVASPVWNVALGGLPPIFETQATELIPVWQPWPGETTELKVGRPEAISGATITVSRGTHTISLGERQRTSRLELNLRCSLGEDFAIQLPPEAEVTSLEHDGRALPVRIDHGKVIVPLKPGEQRLSLGWKISAPLGARFVADEVGLPVESANIDTVITVPDGRWTLWAAGPLRGPAVRFWGILLCSLLAALALARAPHSPLRLIEWMLLAIGLTQVPLPAALVVVGWLFVLVWRGLPPFQAIHPLRYNFFQLIIIALSLASLGILLTVVGEGLLGQPEMFISGNGSTTSTLRWFQPRSESLLPRPACLTISLWWYRFAMLAWALWLATAVIRWLQWAWKQFTTGPAWKRKPAAVVTPPPLP